MKLQRPLMGAASSETAGYSILLFLVGWLFFSIQLASTHKGAPIVFLSPQLKEE